ncbi:MAG TPA: calcium-binding protein [Thermoleophilaceae bacterium]
MSKAARLALVAVLAATALPASAQASSVGLSGGAELRYDAGAGEANAVTISRGALVYTIDDPGVAITPTAPCAAVDADTATCPAPAVQQITVSLDDGNDAGTIGPSVSLVDVSLRGGPGDDRLTGSDANDDFLAGEAGADTLAAVGGNDRLSGGDGDDTADGGNGSDFFDGGAGADTTRGGPGDDTLDAGTTADGPDALSGGPGDDRVSYNSRNAAVTVSLDGVRGDGEAGENDNVGSDVERLDGGHGGDRLAGSAADNTFFASDGNDTVDGAAGDDNLIGSAGDDTLRGGDGDDELSGDRGVDAVDGGAGDDSIFSGNADDEPDRMAGGDGTDLVSYGGANDGVRVTLDGIADDGVPGERDNALADIEDVVGSARADVLIGSASANELTGGDGDDSLAGGAGADGLHGDRGEDALDGGPGIDSIAGDAGADFLRSRDGSADLAACGGGEDTVVGDPADDARRDCERVSRGVAIATRSARLGGRSVRLRLRCPAAEGASCRGQLVLTRKTKRLGARRYSIAPGRSAAVRVRLSRPARRSLRRAGRLRASATAELRDAAGSRVRTRRVVTLRAR